MVAVDGPSGSGKSSVSKGVARELGLRYLDTGAQYRAMTWWVLENGIEPADAVAIAAGSERPRVESGTDPGAPTIAVDGRDVAAEIRSARVTAAVSKVAGVTAVRERLIVLQRAIIRAALADGTGIVVEGRDIADVVWPGADCRIYLTASAQARAARRNAELAGVAVHQTWADLVRRDGEDAKTTRPLDAAPGAVIVDATELTLAQVIDRVVGLATAGRA